MWTRKECRWGVKHLLNEQQWQSADRQLDISIEMNYDYILSSYPTREHGRGTA